MKGFSWERPLLKYSQPNSSWHSVVKLLYRNTGKNVHKSKHLKAMIKITSLFSLFLRRKIYYTIKYQRTLKTSWTASLIIVRYITCQKLSGHLSTSDASCQLNMLNLEIIVSFGVTSHDSRWKTKFMANMYEIVVWQIKHWSLGIRRTSVFLGLFVNAVTIHTRAYTPDRCTYQDL